MFVILSSSEMNARSNMRLSKNRKKTNLNKSRLNKRVIVSGASIGLLIVASVGTIAWLRRNPDNTASINQSNTNNSESARKYEDVKPVEEVKDAITTQSLFEKYKKQIEESSAKTDEEKQELYVNAAFLGAQLKSPEAAGYAWQALSLIPPANLNSPTGRTLKANLEAVSQGRYDIVSPQT